MKICPVMSNKIAVLKREEGIGRLLGLSHPSVTEKLQLINERSVLWDSN